MKAKTAANYLVYIMGEAFDDLTNMKINKLLYYAQGYHLREFGKPLFDDAIEAWEHGPVVPEVYTAYRQYGEKPITLYDDSDVANVPPEAEDILFAVARKYGKYTASALRNMTHVIGSPWNNVYKSGRQHIVIPERLMQEYFAESEDLRQPERQYKESDFIGYRDADGYLVLPKEWDDEEV